MIDPLFHTVVYGFIAGLLFFAAIHKLRSLDHFRGVLQSYRLLPQWSLALFQYLIPAVELALSLALLIESIRGLAVMASVLLLVIYGGAIAFNIYRGNDSLDCGCSLLPAKHHQITPGFVIRNLLLSLVAATVLLPTTGRALTPLDSLQAIVAVMVLGLIYLSVDQWLANQRLMALKR